MINRKEIVAKCEYFNDQVAGKHYLDMQLQPLEAAYLRYGLQGLKACIHTKIDKYLGRTKDDPVEQYMKAQHCLNIFVEMARLEEDAKQAEQAREVSTVADALQDMAKARVRGKTLGEVMEEQRQRRTKEMWDIAHSPIMKTSLYGKKA